ncbi:MAG: DNA/RNA non-specific endonuclease [Muribaculaceae bacterium]|nr:DNA/RNA non-specific endonuclease [Muribaculaceae bacterium]
MRNFLNLCMVLLPLLCASCYTPQNGNEDVATYLHVTPNEIVFNANADNSFVVDCDATWEITASQEIKLSTREGTKGKTTVKVLDMPAPMTTSLLVETPSNSNLHEIVKLSRNAEDDGNDDGNDDGGDTPTTTTIIYYDNFDGDASYNNWANQGTTWQNPTGSGADNVAYETNYTKIKNDSYGSTGKYTNASGKCYVNIYKPGSNIAYFEIHNIATNSEKSFTLSFGAMFKSSHCALYIKGDDSEWKRLEYSASATYNSWAVAEASFSLTNSVNKLSFRFESISTEATYGCSLDDLRLETSEGGQAVDFGAKKGYRWAELPENKTTKADYAYHTHWTTTYSSKKRVRNYSYCYDVRRHSPMWIAHPQHAIYEEGGKTRPATDPWACDPYLTDNESAIIYKINSYTCSLRTYYDSSYQTFYQWGRGHMLPSGYRGCGNANNPAEINKQTFYSSNVAAQRSASEVNEGKDCAFQMLWGAAEKKIQDDYICSDTLYVVSGAHFAHENTTATDANIYSIPEYCKTCIVPTHFYTIVLRTKSGNTGKAIQECSANELKAVGFWFSNTDIDEQTGLKEPTLSRAHMRSVDEIEKLTGNEFNFFPDIPESVEASFNASEWGF